jgi:L-threonylcarbamoyladenylate synthase
MPTETVYGLAGDGLNPAALARIFEIKQRPLYDPLILHFADAEAAFGVAPEVSHAARALAEKFWPGPLTLVVRKRDLVPDLATSGLPKVAIRVPSHPVAQALLRAFASPLAAPSANRFGRISPTDAAAVRAELGDAVPLILDGGPCAVGVESTVVDVSGNAVKLLRAGGISIEEIEAVAGPVLRANEVEKNPAAPGQLAHHYAPRKPLRLVASAREIPSGAENGWLAFGAMTCTGKTVQNISIAGDLREAAANFFRDLRALDEDPRVQVIYAIRVPASGLGLAINERLERASS